MSRTINMNVDNCIQCPFYRWEVSILADNGFRPAFHCCGLDDRLISSDSSRITEDTPIPKWCPLPDGSEVKYYVVRSRVEDVTDDIGVESISIDKISIGKEQYILLSYEEDNGYELVSDLNSLGRENVAVILGRIVTKEEINFNFKPGGGDESWNKN